MCKAVLPVLASRTQREFGCVAGVLSLRCTATVASPPCKGNVTTHCRRDLRKLHCVPSDCSLGRLRRRVVGQRCCAKCTASGVSEQCSFGLRPLHSFSTCREVSRKFGNCQRSARPRAMILHVSRVLQRLCRFGRSSCSPLPTIELVFPCGESSPLFLPHAKFCPLASPAKA